MAPDRPLTYLPMRSEDARWTSCNNSPNLGGASWSRVDSPGSANYHSAILPPPPRPPRLAALLARANEMGLSSSYYDKDLYQKREVHHFSCWRLRWCALCLVIAVALQASTVGSRLQALYVAEAARPPAAAADLGAAALLLALLLIALWSLLSQLLLWSDAAVMKVRRARPIPRRPPPAARAQSPLTIGARSPRGRSLRACT